MEKVSFSSLKQEEIWIYCVSFKESIRKDRRLRFLMRGSVYEDETLITEVDR